MRHCVVHGDHRSGGQHDLIHPSFFGDILNYLQISREHRLKAIFPGQHSNINPPQCRGSKTSAFYLSSPWRNERYQIRNRCLWRHLHQAFPDPLSDCRPRCQGETLRITWLPVYPSRQNRYHRERFDSLNMATLMRAATEIYNYYSMKLPLKQND